MSKINMAKNLILLKLGIPSPLSAVFWVTDYCNSRCSMCSIWRLKEKNEMELDIFKQSFQRSKILRQISLFSFTGGEPFLKKDLVEFVKAVHKYANPTEIRFVTNSILTDKIISDMKEILKNHKGKYNVKLSLDGIGEAHNNMRGIKRCYDKVLATLNQLNILKERYPKKLTMSIGFTATALNYLEIDNVFRLSKEKNTGFFYKPVMEAEKLETKSVNSDLYLTDEQKNYLKKYHNNLYQRLDKRHFSEKVSYNYFYQFLDKYYDKPSRIIPCYAASASFHVAANWDVFTCIKLNHVIGNIRDKSFDGVWNGKRAKDFRKQLKKSNCHCLCTGEIVPSLITYKFPFLLDKKL